MSSVGCGADGWEDIAEFGVAKYAWFRRFLPLANGIPSHDTFGRVIARLDPKQFQVGFRRWIQTVAQQTNGQILPVDGKTLRHSSTPGDPKSAIHMVSAWATRNRLVLAQIKVDEKSNEITAIPALLQLLAISGCIVTIDAMGCQKAIVSDIRAKEADYVIAVKGDQPHLLEDIQHIFRPFLPKKPAHWTYRIVWSNQATTVVMSSNTSGPPRALPRFGRRRSGRICR